MRTEDAATRALENERFHTIIGEMAENEFLMPSLRRLLIDHTRISMTFYNPRKASLAAQRELAADQHDQFIALIEAGDADAAADLAVAHWELSRAQIESFVTPDSITMPLGRAPGATETRGAL
jgi:DNA-binding GntR family transcriptional regulator